MRGLSRRARHLPEVRPTFVGVRRDVIATCQKCHEGATPSFARYDPHADPQNRARNPLLYYTAQFMQMLLVGVFAFFGIHTTLWFGRSMQLKAAGGCAGARTGLQGGRRMSAHRQRSACRTQTHYRRFDRVDRVLHGVLMFSFLGLAVTGLPLLFSDERGRRRWRGSSAASGRRASPPHLRGADDCACSSPT